MDAALPTRDEIPARYKWNAESVFPSPEAWDAELAAINQLLDQSARIRGRLAEGPAVLADALDLVQTLLMRAGKVYAYASMSHAVDTTDQAAAAMNGRAQALIGQVMAATSFLAPELLSVGEPRLRDWMRTEPRLAFLDHYVSDLFRKQAHVRSVEVEELLGMLADPFSGPDTTAGMLTNADFQFPPARTREGTELPVAQGTLQKVLASRDREARRTAWENYHDTYLAFKHTLASNLMASIKQCVFGARARRHSSTLEASLFANNVPVQVFHNLIATFRQNLPTWHRYWAVRRAALGLDRLHPYDVWAPLTTAKPQVSYEEAVDWICQALAPLGSEYVAILRRGCLEDRWVDALPNRGKSGGAFSDGSYGTMPFIMTSFDGSIVSLSTLAHELGHSMHSYLTWHNQPVLYGDYSLFVAEVASNFHQAMVRADLLQRHTDPAFQISLIEEAMNNFHRYFFIMPTLARFELAVHEREERGQGLTADFMIGLMADLFAEGFGSEMAMDRQRVGITWATFQHLYSDYYVYQYATGISGAHALSQRILSGQERAVEDYLGFLKAGGSLYPLEALKRAGVDLATPEPVEATFAVLAGLVDRLEKLVGGAASSQA